MGVGELNGVDVGVAVTVGIGVGVIVMVGVGLGEEETLFSSLLEQALKRAAVAPTNRRIKARMKEVVFIVAALLSQIAGKWRVYYEYVIKLYLPAPGALAGEIR